MKYSTIIMLATAFITSSTAFPFMANYNTMTEAQKRDLAQSAKEQFSRGSGMFPRVHPSKISKRSGAAPYSTQYPYTGAKIDGLPGTQVGGQQVPAPGDTDHAYQSPPAGAYRGPCPGLNTAANHGFLSRDGITTFNELVAAQQNVYNVGYDLAVILAVAGVGLDGDVITGKVSISGDATAQTASPLSIGAQEGGLATHLKFEGDASLTRNDYYTHNGDNFNFNGTLFGYMTTACNKNYDRACLSAYRATRWHQSQQENGQFFFGPGALLLYGAQSFLYELFPTNGGGPDFATISSFFGAVDNGDGTYSHVPERIPDNWFSRSSAYAGPDVTAEILAGYLLNPVLFGGNTGPNNFVGMNYGQQIVDGKLTVSSASGIGCLLQNIILSGVPSTVQGAITTPLKNILYMIGKLNPIFQGSFGCPLVATPSG